MEKNLYDSFIKELKLNLDKKFFSNEFNKRDRASNSIMGFYKRGSMLAVELTNKISAVFIKSEDFECTQLYFYTIDGVLQYCQLENIDDIVIMCGIIAKLNNTLPDKNLQDNNRLETVYLYHTYECK